MSRPVIGITTYQEPARWGVWEAEAVLVPTAYVREVAVAGAVPVLLPPCGPAVAGALARLDGLVVAGGADVDPSCYRAERDPRTGPARPDRDTTELALLAAALERDLPVLAICRGLQLLNVLRGGTLHQHLPDVVGHDGHAPAPGVYGSHPVRVADGSRLARALGRSSAEWSSYHHQAIDRLGEGLTPVAWADDGTVEGVELEEAAFVVGVQGHPEVGGDEALFGGLVAAAAGR